MNKLLSVKTILSYILCGAVSAGAIVYCRPSSPCRDVSAKTIAEIQEERQENEKKISEYEDQMKLLEDDEEKQIEYQEALSGQISLMQENITLMNGELDKLNEEIIFTEENIKSLDQEITDKQNEVDESIESFKRRLCAMYMSSNDDMLSVILGSTNFYDLVTRVQLVNRMAEYNDQLIDSVLEDIDGLEKAKADLQTEKNTLDSRLREQEEKKAAKDEELAQLSQKMMKTDEMLEKIRLEQEQLQKSKEDIQKINEELEREEKAIQEEIRRQAEEAQRRYEEEMKKRLELGQPSESGFLWPAPGFFYISSFYGPRWGTDHNGIDVGDSGISGGTAVAARSGIVAYVCNECTHDYGKEDSCGCGGGYGNYVIISHDGTYSTLYGHLAYASVQTGDYVEQGQPIGLIGSTGWSTGPHLHFEVRVDGVPVDPIDYVSP